MSGLLVGVVLAVMSMGWIFKASNKIVFESDDTKTLGLQFEPAPQVALRPLTHDEMALKLPGIKDGEQAMKEAAVLAERVTAGYLSNDWNSSCSGTYSASLCRAMSEYFTKQDEMSADKNRGPKRSIVFDARKMAQLQGEDFNHLLSRAPDWGIKQIESFAGPALKIESCPHSFSLVLARKLETYLDAGESWELFDRLQNHGMSCLKATDSWAEFLALRTALFWIARGNNEKALPLLEQARAATQKKEEYRTLYWLTRVNHALNRTLDESKVREEMFRRFPLSWHTILAKGSSGVDPLDVFLKAPVYPDKYFSGDASIDLKLAWLQALLDLEGSAYAVKRYGEYVLKDLPTSIDPGVVQFLARSFDRAGFHRLQIVALSSLNYNNPDALNRESLRLLFPKPFFEELDKHSKQLDTALLLGLARQESGFDPAATSNADAKGLLQILPSTARSLRQRVSKADLYDYAHNIEIGSRYVLKLIAQFDGSVEEALAAYNAGQGTLRKWESRYGFAKETILFMDLMPYRETRDYVPSILRNAYWYHRLFPEFTSALNEQSATSDLLRKQLERVGHFNSASTAPEPKADLKEAPQPAPAADE